MHTRTQNILFNFNLAAFLSITELGSHPYTAGNVHHPWIR